MKQTINISRDNDVKLFLQWLRDQQQMFKRTHLSYELIIGFARQFNIFDSFSFDLINMILAYCNIVIIKLFYAANDTKYELRNV